MGSIQRVQFGGCGAAKVWGYQGVGLTGCGVDRVWGWQDVGLARRQVWDRTAGRRVPEYDKSPKTIVANGFRAFRRCPPWDSNPQPTT